MIHFTATRLVPKRNLFLTVLGAMCLLTTACQNSDGLLTRNYAYRPTNYAGGANVTNTGSGGGGGVLNCGQSTENMAPVVPTRAPPALVGGHMAIMKSGAVVVADIDRDVIWIANMNNMASQKFALNFKDEPGRVVEGPAGMAFVALRRRDEIVQINTTTGSMERIKTCALPRGLAFRASDSRLIVGCLDGEVESIAIPTRVRTRIPLSQPIEDIRDVVLNESGLIVTTFRSANLLHVNSTGTVTPIPLPLSPDATPHVAWRTIAKTTGGLAMIRQQHRTTVLPVTTGCSSYYGSNTSTPIIETELVNYVAGNAIVTPLDDRDGAVVLALDVAVSAQGRIAVASAGNSSVMLIGLAQKDSIQLTSQPTSLAFFNESTFVFTRDPAQVIEISSLGKVTKVLLLTADSVASTGHELFHRATDTDLACASCHPEAGDDGHVWPLSDGLRKTPSLRGGISGTKPFHWRGDLSDMNSLMADVMGRRMRGLNQSPERALAVESWLDAQPTVPVAPVDLAAAARGKAIFESAQTQCSTCHSGTQGTNNATVDVGTGLPLQVPRLTELARRAPWFHDGRVGTWDARYEPMAGGVRHGQTSGLSSNERSDLNEYLKSR